MPASGAKLRPREFTVVQSFPVAFVFPGQGSQYVGMGEALYRAFPEARRVFDRTDRVLGFPVTDLCFEGPAAQLNLTENAQPAILAVSIAALRVLEGAFHIRPSWVAGHSLGEYSALVCAGTLDFDDALRVVRERGRLMQSAVPLGQGAMAAILGLETTEVVHVCASSAGEGEVVSPANLNGGMQVVISGTVAGVEKAVALALNRGARRAVPLPVSAPFHCALMEPAREGLRAVLDPIVLRPISVGIVTNVEATVNHESFRVKQLMMDQVVQPVRWEETIQELSRLGCQAVVEIGPGRTLSGLNRRIQRDMKVLNVEKPEDLEKLSIEFGD